MDVSVSGGRLSQVHLGGTQALGGVRALRLVLGVQVEVEARRDLHGRSTYGEREVGGRSRRADEQDEVVARTVVPANLAGAAARTTFGVQMSTRRTIEPLRSMPAIARESSGSRDSEA